MKKKNHWRIYFHDWGTFWYVLLRIWSMEYGLRARTKQFIEFGLKISFTPCYFFKNTRKLLHIELSNSNNYAVQRRSQWDTMLLWRCATSNTKRYYTINNLKISLFSWLPGLPVIRLLNVEPTTKLARQLFGHIRFKSSEKLWRS